MRDVAFKYIYTKRFSPPVRKNFDSFKKAFFWKILSSSTMGQSSSKRSIPVAVSQAFPKTFCCSRPWQRRKLCITTSWKRAFLVLIVFLLNFLNQSLGILFRAGQRHCCHTEIPAPALVFLTKQNEHSRYSAFYTPKVKENTVFCVFTEISKLKGIHH